MAKNRIVFGHMEKSVRNYIKFETVGKPMVVFFFQAQLINQLQKKIFSAALDSMWWSDEVPECQAEREHPSAWQGGCVHG